MKTVFKKLIQENFKLIGLLLLTAMIWSVGCSTTPPPDPLAGWHAASKEPNESINVDYQKYISSLSPEEKKYLGPYPASSFEDGSGQYAIKIKIGINGTSWEHVLIYDKNNKRIKTFKYVAGHYAC